MGTGAGNGDEAEPSPTPCCLWGPGPRFSFSGTWRGAAGRLQPLLPEGLLAAHGPRRQAHPALCLQVTPFPEAYREPLHAYKISEQDTDVRANVRAACPPSAPHPTCPVPCNEPGRLETPPAPRHRPIYPTPRAVPWLHPISPITAGLSPFLPLFSLSCPGAEAAGEAVRAEQGAAGAGEAGAAAPSGEGSWCTQAGDSSGGTFVDFMVPVVSMH